MARKRYLIIGDGASGITAAEALRRLDPGARIGLLTDEPNPGYYRAALTNYLLGELREDQLWCVAPDFYESLKIHRVFARVTAVDAARREIWDSAGSGPIPYDALLVASGARPRIPSFEGAHLPGVMTLRTIQDVREIVERLRSSGVASAAVLGGGPLGLEWAHGLHEHGVKVTIVERSPRFMPRVLDEAASHLLVTRLNRAGIDVVLGENVAQAFPGQKGGVGAITTNTGRALRCDLLGVATGVQPNTEFLKSSGVALTADGGIAVNSRLETSVAGIWAAGDCASVDGEVRQLWEPARLQGRAAALSMAGQKGEYRQAAFYFATRLFDLDFASVGSIADAPGNDVIVDMPRGTGAIAYRKLVLRDGRLVGCLLLGERQAKVRALGRAFKRLIDTQADVRSIRDKLLRPGFFIDGFLRANQLLEPPKLAAATSILPAAKVRGTQVLDLRSGIHLKTEVLALKAAADGTALLPSSLTGTDAATRAIAELVAADRTLAIGAPSARGTRLLSIGLHAEAAPPAAPVARPIRAELELGGQRYPLSLPLVRIGQGAECEVRLSDPTAASLHAEIVQSAGVLYARDMGSRTGTWVNGVALSSAYKLYDGDRIRIGDSELVLRAPELGPRPRSTAAVSPRVPRLEFRSGAAFGLSFALSEEPRIIGRGPEASIRIDELGVSLRHASIRGVQGAHYVCDLGSEAGTFVGPNRIVPGQEVALAENTPVRFGPVDAVYTSAPRALTTMLLRPSAKLQVDAGPERGQSIALGARALVGSQPSCDLRISGLAPVQLEIVSDLRGFWARDVGGGAVFRAGAPLGAEFAPLSHGDLLLASGGVMFRFEESE